MYIKLLDQQQYYPAPVVFASNVSLPTAVLKEAVVFESKAFAPMVVFDAPVKFASKALNPIQQYNYLLNWSLSVKHLSPIATLLAPVVTRS